MLPLWSPSKESIKAAALTRFQEYIQTKRRRCFSSYNDLHAWSIQEPSEFWEDVWDFTHVIGDKGKGPFFVKGLTFQEAQFFPSATLNYAENLLFSKAWDNLDPSQSVLTFRNQDNDKRTFTMKELRHQVALLANTLKDQGFKKGDRAAAVLPHTMEAMIAMLAVTSLGGIWSSASPDFGVDGLHDRFGQIEPVVLFVTDGYRYTTRKHDFLDKIKGLQDCLPTVKATILIPNLFVDDPQRVENLKDVIHWHTLLASSKPSDKELDMNFEKVKFNDPLFIMFSSGTTGVPKCIIHGVGGTLLQHLKEHQLHCDIKPGDSLFYYTTCGWMMWNWQMSAFASGATLVSYDGSPLFPHREVLFDIVEQEKITHFGTSARYLDTLAKAECRPGQKYDLKSLRMILSTASPLGPETFEYVYNNVKKELCVASISGGTDIISCFVLGNPTQPVWPGQIQGPGLGMDVHVFDHDGKDVQIGVKGELVCKHPFPSQPRGFWKDVEGKKYQAAYFDHFPNVWYHGDFIERTQEGGYIIHGRSDTVLNPGGVRIGTAEIYTQVEKIPEVLESLVVGQPWKGDVRIILFVKLEPDIQLTDILQDQIRKVIRVNASLHHVPAKILQVPDIPRTKSGKIVELAVLQVMQDKEIENKSALANPESLEYFKNLPELT